MRAAESTRLQRESNAPDQQERCKLQLWRLMIVMVERPFQVPLSLSKCDLCEYEMSYPHDWFIIRSLRRVAQHSA